MAQLKLLYLFVILSISGVLDTVISENAPCRFREAQYGGVCVCTADYCDYLEDPTPAKENDVAIVSSSKKGLRFAVTEGKFKVFKKFFVRDYDQQEQTDQDQDQEKNINDAENSSSNKRANNTRNVRLNINRDKHYQKTVGFGGSFTGAVAYLMNFLPQNLQDHIYKSYYSKHGIGFNLMRISIGGCDFDLAPWAYNELPENDLLLSNFTIDPRDELRFSQIKRLIEVSEVKNLKIKGAAWSSPPWMKSNKKWTGRSRLMNEYYQTWADYHLKWIELMEENGLPVWAISTGNEPANGVAFMFFVKFMSLGWTPRKQAVWLADHLAPTMQSSKYKDLIIFGNDDQRYTLPRWFNTMNNTRKNSLDLLKGVAVHWYWDEIFKPSFIDTVHERMPDKMIIVTESCIGDKPWQKAAPLLGSWSRGEKYARSFLQNLQHGVNGWIDWNIILDEKGGPNYVNNTVDAPVIVNMSNTTEVFKQPMFYAIGHFSKFIPEGSIRIGAEQTNINIDSVAFLRPDGSISAVLFNSGNANVEITIEDSVRGAIVVNVPPRSINTILYH